MGLPDFLRPPRVFDAVPEAPDPTPPDAASWWTDEWRTLLLGPSLLARAPRLALAPRGDGGPVVLSPGWRAPEATMAPLGAYLRYLGHDARPWGLGTNRGSPERDAQRLGATVRGLHESTGRRVALVGWSLGGVVSREVARAAPDAVSRVITYGTPVVGGPVYTVAAGALGGRDPDRLVRRVAERNHRTPIRVPVHAVFTRNDRVVSWSACLDRTTPDVEHVEVSSTHLGMGFDPVVWELVARRLAARRA